MSTTNVPEPSRETPNPPRSAVSAAFASIPPVLRWAGLEHPKLLHRIRVDLAAARAINVVTPRNLLVAGPSRSGKSSLVSALFQAYLAAVSRTDPRARSLARFVAEEELRGEPGGRASARAPILLGPYAGPLVVLDGASESQVTAIAAIVDARLGERLPTWMTTSLSPSAFRAALPASVTQRFFANGDCLELDWSYSSSAPMPEEEDDDTLELPSRYFPAEPFGRE